MLREFLAIFVALFTGILIDDCGQAASHAVLGRTYINRDVNVRIVVENNVFENGNS